MSGEDDTRGPPSEDDGTRSEDDEGILDVLRAIAHAPPLALDPAAAEPQRGQRLLHFVVQERLGAGGMGVVLKAWDERLERLVALKVLSSRDPRDAARLSVLLREARSAAAVTHPSIAAIYEVGEADGVAFIAMELVAGVTLRARLRNGRFAAREALEVAWQIARGLSRAHQAGIVHRDLKPDNVMIGEDGQVKILDFGIARPIDAATPKGTRRAGHLAQTGNPDDEADQADEDDEDDVASSTRLGRITGTPAYMSPEQRKGEAVDARSDVFSFGVLLHELLTGKLPDDGVSPAASRDVRPELPPCVEPLIARCLLAAREDRFADGGALVPALGEVRRALDAPAPSPLSVRAVPYASRAALLLLGALTLTAALARRPSRGDATAPAIAAVAPAPAPLLRRLTANPADNPIAHASIAPDGRAIAYVDRNGAYVQALGATAAPTRITLPPDAEAELVAWTPDAGRVLVSGQRRGAHGKDLWLAVPDGAVVRVVAHGAFTGLAVSPDGTRLAVAEEDRVGVLPLDAGAASSTIVQKEAGCSITELAWSPDGGRIAFETLCFGSLSDAVIESVAVTGGAPQVAVRDPRLAQESGVGAMAWTRDGRLLYALAEWFPAENGSNLWSVPLDARTGTPSGSPVQVTKWAGTLASVLSVDRTGARVAFLRFDSQADVYVGDIEPGGRLARPRRLTRTDRNERPATWSADGRGVYFISDRNGLYDVFYQGIGDAEARAVVAASGSETGAQLTPDGESLLYWSLPAIDTPKRVAPVLTRAAKDGSAAAPLWTARELSYPEGAGRPQPWEMRFRCPRPAARSVTGDAASCVLSEKEGGALVFRTLDPVRGAGAELRRIAQPTAASLFWDLSPDGTRLAIPSENGPVAIEALDGRRLGERRVPEGCDPIYVTWAADGRGLFVSAECSNAPVFRLYEVPEHGAARLSWDDSPDWILGTEASPDGKRLAVAVKHADDDVWMLDLPPP